MKEVQYVDLLQGPVQLPYCLRRLPVTGQVWLPLNRSYKPLGTPWGLRVWVDYLDFAEHAMQFDSDPHEWTEIWEPGGHSDKLWLKNAITTAAVYRGRRERLMRKPWGPPEKLDIANARHLQLTTAIGEAIATTGWEVVRKVTVGLGLKFDRESDVSLVVTDAVGRGVNSKLYSALRSARREVKNFA